MQAKIHQTAKLTFCARATSKKLVIEDIGKLFADRSITIAKYDSVNDKAFSLFLA
ncbi:MAG: hypothetical protein OEX77_00390 [Candidatus Bathyarchaeota archaeon]|nr:hypothetical protein [Candidatus Bathyarchaeota archaeon]MDH5732271.1 hypothetical protein [Candidatus Bathyarchaeota archaeon]